MEPTDLNSPLHDDERLAAWYRAKVSNAPLSDDGFSLRVMTALPPARKNVATRRRLFCLAGALTGTTVAFLKIFTSGQALPNLSGLGPEVTNAFALPAGPALALASGLAAMSLWYVCRPKLHFRPRF